MLASARSTISRSSASEENGPSENPFPGVSALPTRISSRGTGPSTRVTAMITPAEPSAIRSACCRPSVRGPTPMITNETTSMVSVATTTTTQRPLPSACWIISVASTIATISASSRKNSAVFR